MTILHSKMNWILLITLLITLVIKLIGTLLFLLYFSQIFPTPSQEVRSPISNGIKACPVKWTLFEGKCYFFSAHEKTWDDSQKNCAQSSSRLTVVNSKAEMDFLMSETDNGNYFVGLTRRGSSGRWKWIDNTELDPDVFNLSYKGFDCATVGLFSTSSVSCSVRSRWICEKNV